MLLKLIPSIRSKILLTSNMHMTSSNKHKFYVLKHSLCAGSEQESDYKGLLYIASPCICVKDYFQCLNS